MPAAMPQYTFELHNGQSGIADTAGVSLPNRKGALAYAEDVVGELMRGRELQTRWWCLDVYERDERIFALPFAKFDHTLDHLRPDLRGMVETLCERQRSVGEAFNDIRATIRESRALLARSRGKLYVAAENGRSVIRDK
jgi:hypothetical protein